MTTTPTVRRQDRDQVLRATLEALFGNLWMGDTLSHQEGPLALRAWFDTSAKYMRDVVLPQAHEPSAAADCGARSSLLKALEIMRTLAEKCIQKGAPFSRRELVDALERTKHAFLEVDFTIVESQAIQPVWGTSLEESDRDILPHLVFDQICWKALQTFFSHAPGDQTFLEMFCDAAGELRTAILVAEMGS